MLGKLIGEGKLIDITYLGFESAFDKISDIKQIKKFSRLKVRGCHGLEIG